MITARAADGLAAGVLAGDVEQVVDDDRAVLNGLSELLEDEGYAVATATDGVDALRQLRAGLRPCVILLDLMMREWTAGTSATNSSKTRS